MPAPITTTSTDAGSLSSLATGWTGGDTSGGAEGRTPRRREALRLDRAGEAPQALLVGLILDRDRELAVGDHLAVALGEFLRDLVVGADRDVGVQHLVVD